MIHMHYFELCFTKSRGFAGVRLLLGDYPRGLPFPLFTSCREGFFSETQAHKERAGG